MCLSTGRTPPSSKPCGDRAGNGGDLAGLGAIGAIADDRIGSGNRHVRNRQRNRHRCRAAARSAAIRRAPSRAAASPVCAIPVIQRAIGGARRISSANAAGRGAAPGRLPGRSGPAPAGRPSREIVDQAAQRLGLATLRLKTMRPHGSRLLAGNCRSSAVSAGPATPVMKARIARRLARDAAKGSSGGCLIPLDDAIAAGSLQAASTVRRPVPSRQRGRPARGNRCPWRQDRRGGRIG